MDQDSSQPQSQTSLANMSAEMGSESVAESELSEQQKKIGQKSKEIFQAFYKALNQEFQEDRQNKFVLKNPNFQSVALIVASWMNQRPLRTQKFLMTLEIIDFPEEQIPKLQRAVEATGSIKVIVNGIRIQTKGILKYEETSEKGGDWFYEGNEQFMFIYSKANMTYYRGQVKDLDYHGKGNLAVGYGTNKEGFEYQGYFQNGKRHGHGVQKQRMSLYEGQFKNGQKEGRGEEVIYKRKKKNETKPVFVPKARYLGEFKDGYRHGEGEEEMIGSYHYDGTWQKGQKCGKGTIKYKNGDSYQGEWKNDEFNGIGKYIQKDNCVYEGEFQNGKYHGKGVMTYENGDRYEGDFQNQKKHGQGKYDWAGQDDYYDGEWRNDSAEGQGTSMIKGEFYTGQFKNGKKNGEGELNTEEGDFIRGIWQDGELKKIIEKNGEPVDQ